MRSRNSCILHVKVPANDWGTIYITYSKYESILAIKEKLELHTGIPLNSQILLCSGSVLHDEAYIGELVKGNSSVIVGISLDIRVNGGAMQPFEAPNMTSANCFETKEFVPAPQYRTVEKGINFGGICRNRFCVAHNQSVTIMLGMCGVCNYSEIMFELKCPVCNVLIDEKVITNIYFLGCTVRIKFKIVNGARPQEFEIIAPAHNYTALKNARDMLKYYYIKFTLK